MSEEYNFPKGTTKNSQLELLRHEQQIEDAYRKASQNDFLCFIRGLVIASQFGPQVFENCMADFQRQIFVDMAPSIEALRDGKMPDKRRWWLERTKKASKDADIAAILCWLIAFPTRPFYSQVAAGDKTQASIVKERMVHLLHWNDWLNEHMEIIKWSVRSKKKLADGSPMAKIDIMSSDISGAHGGTPDLLVLNELSHVNKWEFAENVVDNADGVAQGVIIIATNAGFKGTSAEVWRNNALASDEWQAYVWDKPAPWHNEKTIKDAERRNPTSRYKRLWWGQWASGKGDALDERDIDACFMLDGPESEPSEGLIYLASLDLGVKHDHCGYVVLGVSPLEQRIKTAYIEAWEPASRTGVVDLIKVERRVEMLSKKYRCFGVFYDPSQAQLMAQRLIRAGVPMREMPFTGPNLTKMAETMVQVVENGKLQCYDTDDGRLRRDFGKFNVVEKPYGYKLEATSDEFGHADVGTALAIGLVPAFQLLTGYGGLQADDDLIYDDDEEMTDEEIEEMPEELREIVLMDDEIDEEVDIDV